MGRHTLEGVTRVTNVEKHIYIICCLHKMLFSLK
jgi:hypothetical protein